MKINLKNITVTISLLFVTPLAGHTQQGWSALGSGTNALKADGQIMALTSDPSGNIYAAGAFKNDAGAIYVAKWNGSTWTELEGLSSLMPGYIFSLLSDNVGNIYAGGPHVSGSGGFLAKWDGTNWVNLTANFDSPSDWFGETTSDNQGNVYAAFHSVDPSNPNGMHVAKWDGNSWTTLGSFPTNVNISSLVADGSGNVYASFGDSASFWHVTKWNGSNWTLLAPSSSLIMTSQLFGLHVDNVGNLYVRAGEMVARFTNNDWVKLGNGSTPLDGGAGPQICTDIQGNVYATTPFLFGSHDYAVQKWDGSTWLPLGFSSGEYTFNGYISPIISDNVGNIYTAGVAKDSLGYGYVAKYTQSNTSAIFENTKAEQLLDIYPTPSTNDLFLQIKNDHPSLNISILNLLGQNVQSYSVPVNGLKQPFKINVEQLANSQYIIRITGSGVNESRRFTKG